MGMIIIFKPTAKRELERILEYGINEFGETAAMNFFNGMKEKVMRLATMPEYGRPEPLLAHRNKPYRSLIVSKHHKAIYYIDAENQQIVIADIWDMRRLPASMAKRVK